MDYMTRPTAPLTFQQAVQKVLKNNYANFNGRASRAEFWWFILFTFAVGAVCALLYAITDWTFFSLVGSLFNLAVIVPTLAVSWRRLHDTGRAGGWWFINFVPVAGAVIFIIWCAQQGESGPNRFGVPPVA